MAHASLLIANIAGVALTTHLATPPTYSTVSLTLKDRLPVTSGANAMSFDLTQIRQPPLSGIT